MLRPSPLQPAFTIPDAVHERARPIRLVLLDVDGVLTDGRVILGAKEEYKAFDIKDGHGIKMLRETGIDVGIVTGRASRAVERRAAELGVPHLYQGCGEKLPVYARLMQQLALAPDQVAYVGDDLPDLPVLLQVGLGVAVQDAHPLVKRYAHWVTPSAGGRGAVREVCELVLHARGKYGPAIQRYLTPGPAGHG